MKVGATAETRLFLYRENKHQGWVRQLLFKRPPHNLQDNRDTGGIIGPKIRCSITIKNAITQNGVMSKSRRHTIHVRVEQYRFTFSRNGRNQVTRSINLRSNSKRCQILTQVVSNFLFG